MTIKQFDKIIEVVKNGGVVIAEKYGVYSIDSHEITENTDIQDIFNYDEKGYTFCIKDDSNSYYKWEDYIV